MLSQAVPSVEAFANYSKAIEEAFIKESNSITTNKNSVLSLVVILNSQGKAKIWVTSESTDLILLFKNSAESALKKTPICKVLTGATGFASTFIVNNGTLKAKDNLPPIPIEWTEFIKRNNLGEIEASNLFDKLLSSNP